MPRHGRRDRNHAEIVRALSCAGRRVIDLADVGRGCPDLLVSWGGGPNLLMEVKSDGGELTEDQRRFFATWPGPKVVVRCVADALEATGILLGV